MWFTERFDQPHTARPARAANRPRPTFSHIESVCSTRADFAG